MKGRSGETRVRPGCTWKDLDETLWNRYFLAVIEIMENCSQWEERIQSVSLYHLV